MHHEAEAILKIPLNPTWPKDHLIWNFTANGIYMVKSGYKIGMELMQSLSTAQGTSSIEVETKTWTLIYNLPMQSKIRMFLLRTTSDILPSGWNLMRRGLYDSTSCVHCGYAVEDDIHALFYCSFSRNVWRHLPKGLKWIQTPALTFKDLLH